MLSDTILNDLRDLSLNWYELDENSIPTNTYVLRKIKKSEEKSYWIDYYPKLLDLFDGVPFDVEREDLLINRSVTEYEVRLALTNHLDKDRIFWMFRKFKGSMTDSDEKYLDYNDTLESERTRLSYDNLIAWMHDIIPIDRVRIYDKCSYTSYLNRDVNWTQQFNEWCRDVRAVLSSSLDNIITYRESWDIDGCGLGCLYNILLYKLPPPSLVS